MGDLVNKRTLILNSPPHLLSCHLSCHASLYKREKALRDSQLKILYERRLKQSWELLLLKERTRTIYMNINTIQDNEQNIDKILLIQFCGPLRGKTSTTVYIFLTWGCSNVTMQMSIHQSFTAHKILLIVTLARQCNLA